MSNAKLRVDNFFQKYISKSFKRGQIILAPSIQIKQIYYLKKGYVKQYLMNSDGRIKAVNIYKPNSFFPIVLALTNEENRYFFEAINKVDVNIAPVSSVLQFIDNQPEITLDLFKRFFIGIDGVMNILQSLMYENSQKKLAAFLLMLSQRFGIVDGQRVRIDIPLTHQDLASFTGMIRETVSFEMKKLQEQGIVCKNKCRKTIAINNLSRLRKILG